ncbi:T9SS type A sorting domain-containing protein, partial [Acinetobacter baumannii]
VQLYPNPANKRFNASFFSEKDNQPLTLRIIEAATGKVVATKSVTAVKGENNVSVDLMNSSSNNIYIISLDGDGIQYKKAKIL